MADRAREIFPDFTLDVFEERHHFDPPTGSSLSARRGRCGPTGRGPATDLTPFRRADAARLLASAPTDARWYARLESVAYAWMQERAPSLRGL
jgi:hypothetical protein